MSETTNKITYVSLENLEYYDEKIKSHIQTKDDALNTAISNEVTRAKAAEATNALAAENAQAAADKAQGDVDALAGKVGEVPENSTVMGIIQNIQESAYDDTELRGLVTANKDAIDGVKADYLKAADKTELSGLITAEKERAMGVEGGLETRLAAVEGDYLKKTDKDEVLAAVNTEKERALGVEGGLEDRIETMEAFWEAAQADGTDSNVIDTLKEIQEYIASDETGASQMAASIKQNSDDIDALEGRMDTAEGDIDALEGRMTTAEGKVTTLEGKVSTLEGEMDDVQGAVATKAEKTYVDEAVEALEGVDAGHETRIAALEGKFGESGSVATDIATAKQEAIDAAAADATSKANQALVDAKAYADEEDAKIESRVDALEAASATHALASDLTALAGRVTTAEGEIDTLQSEMDAVEALAAANKAAHEANAAAIALKASQADLEALDARVVAVEEWQANMVECETSDIDALFA